MKLVVSSTRLSVIVRVLKTTSPQVAVLLLLDTITCAFDIAMTYDYLVTNFGERTKVKVVNISLTVYIIANFFYIAVLNLGERVPKTYFLPTYLYPSPSSVYVPYSGSY